MRKVERVAREICRDITGDVYDFELYLDTATAAIRAMREPTEQMIAEADWRRPLPDPYIVDAYQAMIDAALSEGSE